METDREGNNIPIVIPDEDKPATGVAMPTPGGGEGEASSASPGGNGSPIDTRGNTAYLPVALGVEGRVRDCKYVDMPSRQK